MFQLEIDYGWCAGGCKDCKLSDSRLSSQVTTFSPLQRQVISRVVDIFWASETQKASLSFSNCVTLFSDTSDFPEISIPVVRLLLNVKTPDASVDAVLRWIRFLLSRYPQVRNLDISFYRWSANLELQLYALQYLVADTIDLLSSWGKINKLGFGFWANDCDAVHDFSLLDAELSGISGMSCGSAVVESLQKNSAARIGDVIDIQDFWLERFSRRSLVFSLPQERQIWFFLYLEKNDPVTLSVERALQIIKNTEWPNFHISPRHTFLYHHPLLARVPGMIIPHAETLLILDKYQKGASWTHLAQESVTKHSTST